MIVLKSYFAADGKTSHAILCALPDLFLLASGTVIIIIIIIPI